MRIKQTLVLITTGVILVACAIAKTKEASKPGIVVANMNTSVSPKDDFYEYVNGTWLANNEIPADRTRWGSFDELRKKTDEDALAILKKAALNPISGEKTDQQKAVVFFETIMDTVYRDSIGISPLKTSLEKIDAISSIADLQEFLAYMEPYGGIGFVDFEVFADLKNSSINVAYLNDSGLGLSRDYYVDQDDDTKEKRIKYQAHVSRMLQFLGESKEDADLHAEQVLNFEISLATPKMTKEESRDARNVYNPMSVEELTTICNSFDWDAYFEAIGVGKLETIVVTDLGYFKALDNIIKKTDVETLKTYLRWNLIDRGARKLTTEIDYANWEFYSKELRGAKKPRSREERALADINRNIGEALGKLYVDEKFPPEAKEKAKAMIENIMVAFENRINKVDWMSDSTKVKAIEKLDKMGVKIGYPDKWEDYSTLTIQSTQEGGTCYANSLAVAKWNYEKELAELNKEVDKSKWGMSPQTVNAYFHPVHNEIVFPAAILQPPFYDYKADEAINYGGIGAVIGHEISHCFDDSGSRFDADGNLNNWWTEEDLERFTARGKKLVAQYSAVEVLDSVYINGEFTLGENIGDLGGINVAYDGLQMFLDKNGRPEKIDGFTPEQRFYISWATVWRSKSKEDALRNQIKTDPHSPAQYRGQLPQRNTDAFHQAFGIVAGDGMYLAPEDRVKIW